MKIGFYGNANNYPFMLARAMQRLGHEVRFLVASRERLNRPEHRYPDISAPYPPWIVDVSRSFRWHALVPGPHRHRILSLLNGCDALVLNEEGPALARELRVPWATLLTGSDIDIFADPTQAHVLRRELFHRPAWLRAAAAALMPDGVIRQRLSLPQRFGIHRARAVAFLPAGLAPKADQLLTDIGVTPARRLEIQFTDLDLAPYHPPSRRRQPKIFCATRLTWKSEPGSDLTPLDFKGSDIMLRGLAHFMAKAGFTPEIHLVRKGRHIVETEQLARELGLADRITWHQEMTQREVLQQFAEADIVIEQLAGSVVGMAGLDAMATGRPLIANGRPEIFEPLVGEPSPICQARTPEEVCAQLARLARDPAERERVGLASRRYVEKHFSSDAAARQILARLGPSPAAIQ
jgi:glycosyltransferase involved in cell wall biosynthesis